MHATIEWDSATPEEVAQMFRDLQSVLIEKLEGAAKNIGVRIRRDAQSKAPVDETRLRDNIESVVSNVSETLVRIEVGTNVEYAAPQEFGTDPFFPPPSELRGWARRQLGDEDAAFLVARSISETGIEEQPFLGPAFQENIEYALDQIKQAVDAAFEEVFG